MRAWPWAVPRSMPASKSPELADTLTFPLALLPLNTCTGKIDPALATPPAVAVPLRVGHARPWPPC